MEDQKTIFLPQTALQKFTAAQIALQKCTAAQVALQKYTSIPGMFGYL